jgi:uncharacterized membrane protein
VSNIAGAFIAVLLIATLYEANQKIGALVVVLVIIAMLAYAAKSGALTSARGA